jgi:hypothetical protein
VKDGPRIFNHGSERSEQLASARRTRRTQQNPTWARQIRHRGGRFDSLSGKRALENGSIGLGQVVQASNASLWS